MTSKTEILNHAIENDDAKWIPIEKTDIPTFRYNLHDNTLTE